MSYTTYYGRPQNGLSNSETGKVTVMGSEDQGRPKLTAKGERTRARIVEAAARLVYERGVAATTLDDVRAAAGVSGSQMYHYFPGKDELVQAVIRHQAAVIAANQRQADLGRPEGLRAWRDMVISQAGTEGGKGGCPLGSLAGKEKRPYKPVIRRGPACFPGVTLRSLGPCEY